MSQSTVTKQPGSGVRVEKSGQSEVVTQPLSDPQTLQALQTFLHMCKTSLGPSGSLHNVHNNVGGHVTTTSCSQRLMAQVSFSHPLCRLVRAAVSRQLKMYSDGGLFTGAFGIKLILELSQLTVHRCAIAEILTYINTALTSHLVSTNHKCACKFKLDFSKSDHFFLLARSVLASKPLCGFSELELSHMTKICVETFLKNINIETERCLVDSNVVHYVLLEGERSVNTQVLDGLLFEAPHIPTYLSTAVKCQTVKHTEHVRAFVVSISLAGDTSELPDITYEIHSKNTSEKFEISSVILSRVMMLCEFAVKNEVGLFVCQKVIHPRAKAYLMEHDVMVLDRLGAQVMAKFLKLTGATSHIILEAPVDTSTCGMLSSVSHTIIAEKSFIHFKQQGENTVQTVLLCHRNEESLNELRCVFDAALSRLLASVTQPWALIGGGVWQKHLAQHLQHTVSAQKKQWAQEICIRVSDVTEVCEVFIRSLLSTVRSVTSYNNITDTDSSCLLLIENLRSDHCCESCDIEDSTLKKDITESSAAEGNKQLILDSYGCSLNALQTAVDTAAMVLKIHLCVNKK